MRISTPQAFGRLSLAGALSAGLLFAACADTPTALDAGLSKPSMDHAGNHPATAGGTKGKVTASFVGQPTLSPSSISGWCSVDYSVEIAGKGPEQLVRWSTYRNDAGFNIGSNTLTVGSKVDPFTIMPTGAVTADDEVFTLTVRITNDDRSVAYAEAVSDPTLASC